MQAVDESAHIRAPRHKPVLLRETLADLGVGKPGRMLDCTVGLGGHSAAALEEFPQLQLCGLDRDAQALKYADVRLHKFGKRISLFQESFADFETPLGELGWQTIDAALLDLGVSSMQLDTPERGFSFRNAGPLDMRMSPQNGGLTAAELVNRSTFDELRNCFATLGEDPQAGRIARAIVNARQKKPIGDTLELAEIIRKAYPPAWRRSARRHPATRCFQALRMTVNDELGQLQEFLRRIFPYLAPKATLVIISFHSLEDRLVKHAFREWAAMGKADILHKKPLTPAEAEVSANPRAASAKLRAIQKRAENE